MVPQETALFNRSIRENIRYGRPDASDEEVVQAARRAFCDSFIRELPQGYDTPSASVGDARAASASAGIARAFLDAPILILDEATSALDTQSEAEIRAALDNPVHNRTVVAVAHRPSTLSSFDRIIVLRDGRIVEDGPPRELRRRGGEFDGLWRMQAEGFNRDTAKRAMKRVALQSAACARWATTPSSRYWRWNSAAVRCIATRRFRPRWCRRCWRPTRWAGISIRYSPQHYRYRRID